MESKTLDCPVDRTLNLINKKWSIQILRDMFFGKKHFSEFKDGKAKLSNKVLSECLKNLENNGLIKKEVLNTTPITTQYNLTDYGRSMNRIIYELAMFTLDSENNSYTIEEQEFLKDTFKKQLDIGD